MPLNRAIAALAGGAMIATGMLATPAAAVIPVATAASAPAGQSVVDLTAGRYIVTLEGDAAATYEGGLAGLARTLPRLGDQLDTRLESVESYVDYLEQKQQQLASRFGVSIGATYTLALNGFAADLTAEQAAALALDPEVASLTPDSLLHTTAIAEAPASSAEFLGLTGDDGVWAATGGVETAGDGIVLGVLDTGIAPENPSFEGEPLGVLPGGAPYYSAPGVVSYAKADGGAFTGVCQTGEQFDTSDCSTKVVGARYFVDGFDATGTPASAVSGEFLSPRDGAGHGSHTASTAVGVAGVDAEVGGRDFGRITGVAPAAKLAVYKVCWTGDGVTTLDGCAFSDIISAIDAAVDDGVDALNYSIGGAGATTTVSPVDQAFLGAASAGVFVAASAGNDGPGASTLDNASPWITTVAASTIPSYEATVELADGERFAGASVTVDRDDADPLTGRLVTAASVALADAQNAELCLDGTLDPAATAGVIVVCERGVNDRTAKSAEVKRAGGIGMVLVNVTPGSTDLDDHAVPTVHLDARHHDRLFDYAGEADATATFYPGNRTGVATPVPQIAGFSSRGPVLAEDSDILKPDITAPGVGILAATANAEGEAPTWEFYSGTSMSSPQIAGLAVLYLGESPLASPAEIKSAMMTTAHDLVDADGDPFADPFAQGAGQVDPGAYLDPALVYLSGSGDWASYIAGAGYPQLVDPAVVPIDPSDLNLASITIGSLAGVQTVTRTVTATEAGTFTATASVPGVTVTVEPSVLTFGAAGESASYTVSFTAGTATPDEFATGFLTWESDDAVVRSPLAVRPAIVEAPRQVGGSGVSGSVEVPVVVGTADAVPLSSTGLIAGALVADPFMADPSHSGSGVTGQSSTFDVSVPEGVGFVRFALDSLDDTADVNLVVLELDTDGQPVTRYGAEGGAPDEHVDIESPASDYLVLVQFADAPQKTVFDLTAFDLPSADAPEGGAPVSEALDLTPGTLRGAVGDSVSYTAAWSDLAASTSYLGRVVYGDSARSTLVSVSTAEASGDAPIAIEPPVISGTPETGSILGASTGIWNEENLHFAFQWRLDGRPIPGATASTYRPGPGSEGQSITVVVTATTLDGLTGTATSEPVTVKYATTTRLRLSSSIAFSSQRVTAAVTVRASGGESPVGSVLVKVNGRVVQTVKLDETDAGRATYTLPRSPRGSYLVEAAFQPAGETTTGSLSPSRLLWVIF